MKHHLVPSRTSQERRLSLCKPYTIEKWNSLLESCKVFGRKLTDNDNILSNKEHEEFLKAELNYLKDGSVSKLLTRKVTLLLDKHRGSSDGL